MFRVVLAKLLNKACFYSVRNFYQINWKLSLLPVPMSHLFLASTLFFNLHCYSECVLIKETLGSALINFSKVEHKSEYTLFKCAEFPVKQHSSTSLSSISVFFHFSSGWTVRHKFLWDIPFSVLVCFTRYWNAKIPPAAIQTPVFWAVSSWTHRSAVFVFDTFAAFLSPASRQLVCFRQCFQHRTQHCPRGTGLAASFVICGGCQPCRIWEVTLVARHDY